MTDHEHAREGRSSAISGDGGEVSPFAVLGLEPRMTLPAADIERAYRMGAAATHPDRAGSPASASQRGGSSPDDPATHEIERIQEARRVLLNPELRAAALLDLHGGPGASEDRSLPDGFLMEILETRMEIEAATAGGGAPAAPDVLDHWEQWADEQRAGYIRRVAALFDSTGQPGSADVLREIRRELNAWRYIERLIEQLDPDYDAGRADFAGG